MPHSFFNRNSFETVPVVGILRNYSLEEITFIGQAYAQAGMSTLEITIHSPGAEESIRWLISNFPQLNVGAGTICTMEDLKRAESAGVSFIVSPILDISILKESTYMGLASFPGAMTPTEIYQAWDQGATAVKVFPATGLGPSYIKEIKAPLPNINLLPTGGVSKSNLHDYLKAGAYGVGMGSALFDQELLSKRDFEGLCRHFEEIGQIAKMKE